MDASNGALEAAGVCKLLAGAPILRGVDLRLREGEIVALRGANGSGKTTLLRCLAGRLRPDSGEVRWGGRPADRHAGRLVGMLGHETALYPHLTLRENLRFAARMGEVAEPLRCAEQWLAHVGLTSHADRLPGHVSRGMRQRVALARACIHDPPILLLDEPFSGLDVDGTAWLTDLLGKLAGRGRAICLVTHEEALAGRLAHTILELCGGRVYATSAPKVAIPAPSTAARAA